MPFHFNMVVWGDEHVRLFIELVLPNQLTPGNLGCFAGVADCRYRIFTTARDRRAIEAADAYRSLAATMPVDVIVDDELGARGGHEANYEDMTRAHQQAVRDAARDAAVLVFLPADALWSEGAFAAMARRLAEGYRAVMVPGIRLVRETGYDAFRLAFHDARTGTAPAPPRRLARFALGHLHPLIKATFHDSTRFITWPSLVMWPVPGEGLIVRGFHLHPMAVDTGGRDVEYEVSLDQDLIAGACPLADMIHVVTDSDEMIQVSLEPEAHRRDLLPQDGRLRLRDVVEWARKFSDPVQQEIFTRRAYCLHADELGPSWQGAKLESQAFAEVVGIALAA